MKKSIKNGRYSEEFDDRFSHKQLDGKIMTIEDVLKYPDCKRMLNAQLRSHYEIKAQTKILGQYIKTEKIDSYLMPESKSAIRAIDDAKCKLFEIGKDMLEFIELMGEFSSIDEMSDAIDCELWKIDDIESEAGIVYDTVWQLNPTWTPSDVAEHSLVRSALDKCNRIKYEYETVVENLNQRYKRAGDILRKYE